MCGLSAAAVWQTRGPAEHIPSSYVGCQRLLADLMAQRGISKAVRAKDAMLSRARVYADVNVHNSREYWDYENLSIQWG